MQAQLVSAAVRLCLNATMPATAPTYPSPLQYEVDVTGAKVEHRGAGDVLDFSEVHPTSC